MALADITEKILIDAQKRADDILADAGHKAEEIHENTENLKHELAKEGEASLEKTLTENEKRVTSAALQETKLELERTKREMVDEVFSSALKHLCSLADKEYESFLVSLMEKIPKHISGVITAASGKISITEKAVKSAGIDARVKEEGGFEGGFLFTGEKFEYNATFERIVEDTKGELEIEVARILFN